MHRFYLVFVLICMAEGRVDAAIGDQVRLSDREELHYQKHGCSERAHVWV